MRGEHVAHLVDLAKQTIATALAMTAADQPAVSATERLGVAAARVTSTSAPVSTLCCASRVSTVPPRRVCVFSRQMRPVAA